MRRAATGRRPFGSCRGQPSRRSPGRRKPGWRPSGRRQPRPRRSRPRLADAGTIPILGKVAAGDAILVTGEFGFLTVPARYAERKNVYALKVQGDSMIGDDIRDGDYIIVVAQQQIPESGEIVVVTVPSEDGGEGNGMVKKWRPQPGGSVLLESSNSAVAPIPLTRRLVARAGPGKNDRRGEGSVRLRDARRSE